MVFREMWVWNNVGQVVNPISVVLYVDLCSWWLPPQIGVDTNGERGIIGNYIADVYLIYNRLEILWREAI